MRLNIFMALLMGLFFVNVGVCQENAPALKDNTFVMAFIRPETEYFGKFDRLIFKEVFRRLGIKDEFRDYPGKRAGIEADEGAIDGEPARPYQYAAEHPNLIRVEEFIFKVNFSAFAMQASIPQLNGWESLKGTNYRVDYQRGVRTTETNLSKVVSKENLSDIIKPAQGLKKLASGRTDIFVEEETGILSLLQTPEFIDSKIRLAGVMESVAMYPYIHKKHAALAPKMAEVIKAMKAEGVIEQYRAMADKEFGVVRK
jgi:hypothetical protein